ncbi:MAG: hypothetical protein ABIN18_20445 [Pseudomonadota bacterium]
MSQRVRVNWRQRQRAADRLVRVHKVLTSQPPLCQFSRMRDCQDFQNEAAAKAAMRSRAIKHYKRCKHCWDNSVQTA